MFSNLYSRFSDKRNQEKELGSHNPHISRVQSSETAYGGNIKAKSLPWSEIPSPKRCSYILPPPSQLLVDSPASNAKKPIDFKAASGSQWTGSHYVILKSFLGSWVRQMLRGREENLSWDAIKYLERHLASQHGRFILPSLQRGQLFASGVLSTSSRNKAAHWISWSTGPDW